jgi:hypothetical protein
LQRIANSLVPPLQFLIFRSQIRDDFEERFEAGLKLSSKFLEFRAENVGSAEKFAPKYGLMKVRLEW